MDSAMRTGQKGYPVVALPLTSGQGRESQQMEPRTVEEDKFVCAACGIDFERESSVMECRMCHRSHCEECLNEQKLCVPCSQGEA